MQVVQTEAPPPKVGSRNLPAMGCTWNTSTAPASTAVAYRTALRPGATGPASRPPSA